MYHLCVASSASCRHEKSAPFEARQATRRPPCAGARRPFASAQPLRAPQPAQRQECIVALSVLWHAAAASAQRRWAIGERLRRLEAQFAVFKTGWCSPGLRASGSKRMVLHPASPSQTDGVLTARASTPSSSGAQAESARFLAVPQRNACSANCRSRCTTAVTCEYVPTSRRSAHVLP